MLDPETRSHTLENLRPPQGYELDRAIATTFSLDLLALLTAPLAFTLFDWEDEEGRTMNEPLAILESLRRYADRISVFCQAGRIGVPKTHQLFGYLEDSIFQVTARRPSAVFHPKLWVLRFCSAEAPVRYRVLLPTRNLTFERCWDTVLTLEGWVVERQRAYAANHPLSAFIAALPDLCKIRPPRKTQDSVELICEELRRVDFEVPEPFREMTFWSMGVDVTRRWPFPNTGRAFDRVLVMSPFVSDGCLSQLSGRRGQDVLISRPDELAKLRSATISGFNEVLVLNPSANLGEEAEGMAESASGVHAKLYIIESGGQARVWTGSANATNAAYGGNIEFLVEFVGDRNKCGIDSFLTSAAEQTTFRDLLQPFDPSTLEIDAERIRLESIVEEVRCAFAGRKLLARVSTTDDESLYALDLELDEAVTISNGVRVKCRPITLQDSDAVSVALVEGNIASFNRVSFAAITSFFVFDVSLTENQKTVSIAFVMNARLEGAPADRKERILQALLSDKSRVLSFMLLLLAEGGTDARAILVALQKGLSGNGADGSAFLQFPLFEVLVRTLDRNPKKLDQISNLVADLKKTVEGRAVLPDQFDEIWQPIWSAREALRGDSESKATKH
jgi:hypothetical protein